MDPDPVLRNSCIWIRFERLDPDPVCPERLYPDPVNIRPDPKPSARPIDADHADKCEGTTEKKGRDYKLKESEKRLLVGMHLKILERRLNMDARRVGYAA